MMQELPTDEGTTADSLLAMDTEGEAEAGIATDATLNSDAAVGGSVGGGSGERRRGGGSGGGDAMQDNEPGIPSVAEAVPPGGGHHINEHARQRHYRKRALSMATSSGTIETFPAGTSQNDNANGNNNSGPGNLSGVSLMNSSAIGSNIMSSGAEHSIVSFGINFNFDSTPLSELGGEGSSEDDNNGNQNAKGKRPKGVLRTQHDKDKKKKVKTSNSSDDKNDPSAKNSKNSSKGSGSGGSGSSKKKKKKKHSCVKFTPDAGAPPVPQQEQTTGEGEEGSENSASSSDSSMNDNNDSGGSASGGSNSGNDGSSGGKSTVSSLTTSSNQEWMATNESAEAAAAVAAAAAAEAAEQGNAAEVKASAGKASGENCVADGKDPSTKKKDATSGKKRKKASKPTSGSGNCDDKANGNEDDDGYKTDEEQWGVNRNGADGSNQGANALLPGCGPVAKHKGTNSLLKSNSMTSKKSTNSNGSNEGPPLKQARFSMDHEHPQNVQSADASAQPLSSLSGSDSAGVPAVTNSSGGQTPGVSNSSATKTATTSNPSSSSGPTPNRAKSAPNKLKASGTTTTTADPDKRKERNAREKERSCRIARQIDDLRTLLSRGGVIVAKGTKSSVLSEAANYIDMLQQQQVQWEIEKQAMMQQFQQIGIPPSSMTSLSPQNDVSMSQGGCVPGMGNNMMVDGSQQGVMPQQMPLDAQQGLPGQGGTLPMNPLVQAQAALPQNGASVTHNDYKFIFNNSSVGMAIASLGGAFIDCNSIFCQLSEYTKEEVTAMTIFNMTSRQDLQHAFDLISQMITPTLDSNGADKGEDKSSIVLRGAMKKRSDLGLSISLIKGEQGIAKCFCVTLVRILSMETTRPDTVSIEMELPQVWSTKQQKNVGFGASPAYTSG